MSKARSPRAPLSITIGIRLTGSFLIIPLLGLPAEEAHPKSKRSQGSRRYRSYPLDSADSAGVSPSTAADLSAETMLTSLSHVLRVKSEPRIASRASGVAGGTELRPEQAVYLPLDQHRRVVEAGAFFEGDDDLGAVALQ